MNDNYARAFEYLMRNEGGFVNNPKDPGGATKYGVTRPTLERWWGHPVTMNDIVNLTRDDAFDLYAELWWKPLKCDTIFSLPIATAVFDMAVLFGLGTSVIFAQEALKYLGRELLVDGYVGPTTQKLLSEITPQDFLKAFHLQLYLHVSDIVNKNQDLVRFEDGWRNRIDRLLLLTH